MVTAAYTGSFDPFHDGHLSIVEQAAHLFDRVVVAVLGNPEKTTGMFSVPERVDLIRASVAHLDDVDVRHHAGMAVELVSAVGADVIVRSAHKEHHHELSMALMNEAISTVRTVLLTPDASTSWLSSSFVRHAVTAGRSDEACKVVPPPVRNALRGRVLT